MFGAGCFSLRSTTLTTLGVVFTCVPCTLTDWVGWWGGGGEVRGCVILVECLLGSISGKCFFFLMMK